MNIFSSLIFLVAIVFNPCYAGLGMNWLYKKWGISADRVNNRDFKFASETELSGSAFSCLGCTSKDYEARERLMRKIYGACRGITELRSLDDKNFLNADKKDVVACKGQWTGHIGLNDLCSDGWHVCNASDVDVVNEISYESMIHVPGCYGMNMATSDAVKCSSCVENDTKVMQGLGNNCPRHNRADKTTCLKNGLINLGMPIRDIPEEYQNMFTTCGPNKHASGTVCCRDHPLGRPPTILHQGRNLRMMKHGHEASPFECVAKSWNQYNEPGVEPPKIRWYINGGELPNKIFNSDLVSIATEDMGKGKIKSVLTVKDREGLKEGMVISCEAENEDGKDTGLSWQIHFQRNHQTKGCSKKSRKTWTDNNYGVKLPFLNGDVYACPGSWKGHVSRAKKLCSYDFHVCEAFSHNIRISDIMSVDFATDLNRALPGCFAMDAALTKSSNCKRCDPNSKNNTMLGLGSSCGGKVTKEDSCFGTAFRNRVWPNREESTELHHRSFTRAIVEADDKARRSCDYNPELTTGVLCCRTSGFSIAGRRQCKQMCMNRGRCVGKNTCKCPRWWGGPACKKNLIKEQGCGICGENSKCNNKKTKCVCDKGYRNTYSKCVPRKK